MVIINLGNIENLILENKELRLKFPELRPYVDIWEFTVRNPSRKKMRLQTALDFLNALQESQIETLETYFGCPVTIDKLDYRIVKNLQFSIDNLEAELNRIGGNANLTLHRRDNQIYISIWK